MPTKVLLKHKTTGATPYINAGYILPEDKRDKKIDGSFLTLRDGSSGEETYYLWKYWAENEYEVIGEIEVERSRQDVEREEKAARDLDALLAAKANVAAERKRELEAYAKLEKKFLDACAADSELNEYYEKVKAVLNNDAPGFFLGVKEGESLSLFDKYNALGVNGIKDLLK